MNQRLWGMTTESWAAENAEKHAVKAADGKVRPEVYNTFTKQPCASMCLGTDFWRRKYAGLAEQAVADLGVSGIYMDQGCSSLACYDPAHGHPRGGGTYWMQGFQKLAGDIRHRCVQHGVPVPALAGEGCGESWLPYLDLMLSLQVSKERYAGPDGWETIPFFHAVYHPHTVLYGNYSSLTMPPYDDLWPAEFAPAEPLKLLDRKFSRQFYLEQARAFVWGQQPTIANFLPSHLRKRSEEVQYVLRLAKLRSRALKYLRDGTFLRAPAIEAPSALVPISRLSIYAGQRGGLIEFQKSMPFALAAAWRAADGGVGIALASIADETLDVTFQVDPEYYRVPRSTRPFLVDDRGRRPLSNAERGNPLTIKMPPRGACIVEFEPK
jgi:hypothetical protein